MLDSILADKFIVPFFIDSDSLFLVDVPFHGILDLDHFVLVEVELVGGGGGAVVGGQEWVSRVYFFNTKILHSKF